MDSRKSLLILASGILLLLPIIFSSIELPRSGLEIESATVLPEPIELPDFLLTNQDGAAFTRSALEGRFSLLFFGFTNCPDICPATLQQLAVVRKRLSQSRTVLPDVVLVSVDPERDTPETLGRYVGHFGDGFVGVTGEMPELRKLTSHLGIYFEYGEGESDNYNVNHSVVILAVNRDAALQAIFSAPHDIDRIANDVQVLMAER